LPGAKAVRSGQSNVEAGEKVEIRLFDPQCREVQTLFSGRLMAGRHEVYFSADYPASGVSVYTVRARTHQAMRKMLLAK
jgi:hypothetical protein